MSLHEKLVAIQSELKAPRGQTNTFGNYKYRSCEDILESVKPLLKEHGLMLTLSDEIVPVGSRFYVKATARVWDGTKDYSHFDSAATASATAFAREEEQKKGMDGAQITGSASSYARKYALNGLFCIDDTKDADTMDNRKEATVKPAEAPPNVLAKIKELALKLQVDLKKEFNLTGKPTPERATDILTELMLRDRKLNQELDAKAA